MKVETLQEFNKKLAEAKSTLFLLIGKEEVDSLCPSFIRFTEDNFTLESFETEAKTLPLFSNQRFLFIKNVDRLKKAHQEEILNFIKNPLSTTLLLLSSETCLQPFVKEIEKQGGIILDVSKEKAWERERHLIDHLKFLAQKEKKELSFDALKKMVHLSGKNEEHLFSELEKLITFVGDREKITEADVDLISVKTSQETLWKLGEAIFHLNYKLAYEIGSELLEGDLSFFALLAHLRGQMKKGLEMKEAYQKGSLNVQFPYLKGNLLQKKIEEIMVYKDRYKNAFIKIVECEIEAKNSNQSHLLLFELLLVELCR